MPAATTKAALMAVTAKEYDKLRALIDDIPADQANRAREDSASIKSVIGHRAHWIALFLGWYHDGMAGKTVYFPAKGYKWNDLKAFNANLAHEQAHMTWDSVRDLLAANHEKLIHFIESHSDADLYGGPMKGANNKWTPGRWAEAAGPSHYRSAAKWVRACLRADTHKA